MMRTQDRLDALGISLPRLSYTAENYLHHKQIGDLLYLAGKGPLLDNGAVPVGRVGAEFSTEQAYGLSRTVALFLISAMKDALGGDLDRVKTVVKVFGMVNAIPEFRDHAKVIDGCSDLFVDVWGEEGRHVRMAVGSGSLPYGMPIEIEALVLVRGD
ncbi:RidA family protein [Sphingobium sp. B2]|uniref:RidA family protein n=1 Tax=Sphingobium sp. B2 TaxID=2583228 RepID=UPI001C943A57|nr:RidA family protein [Sphingobium sp. B2]